MLVVVAGGGGWWWWLVGGVAFTVAPGAEKDRKATALSGTKQNGHFRRQSSIDFGAGMVHLKPEWSI